MEIICKVNHNSNMLNYLQIWHVEWVFPYKNFFLTNKNMGTGLSGTMSKIDSLELSDKVGYIFPRFLCLLSLSCRSLDRPAQNWVHWQKLSIVCHMLYLQKLNCLNLFYFSPNMKSFVANIFLVYHLNVDVTKSKICTQVYQGNSRCSFPNLVCFREFLYHILVVHNILQSLALTFLVLNTLYDKKTHFQELN